MTPSNPLGGAALKARCAAMPHLTGTRFYAFFMVYVYSYSNLWFMVLSAKILWFMGIQTPPKTPSWRMVVLLLWARLQRLVILSALLEAKTMRVSFDEFCIGPTV